MKLQGTEPKIIVVLSNYICYSMLIFFHLTVRHRAGIVNLLPLGPQLALKESSNFCEILWKMIIDLRLKQFSSAFTKSSVLCMQED